MVNEKDQSLTIAYLKLLSHSSRVIDSSGVSSTTPGDCVISLSYRKQELKLIYGL
jgi:hypothetical protein